MLIVYWVTLQIAPAERHVFCPSNAKHVVPTALCRALYLFLLKYRSSGAILTSNSGLEAVLSAQNLVLTNSIHPPSKQKNRPEILRAVLLFDQNNRLFEIIQNLVPSLFQVFVFLNQVKVRLHHISTKSFQIIFRRPS